MCEPHLALSCFLLGLVCWFASYGGREKGIGSVFVAVDELVMPPAEHLIETCNLMLLVLDLCL